jgi:hypothetical protein
MFDIINQLGQHSNAILSSLAALKLIDYTLLSTAAKTIGDGALEGIGSKILNKFIELTGHSEDKLDESIIQNTIISNPKLQQELTNEFNNIIQSHQSALNNAELGSKNKINLTQTSKANNSSKQESLNNAKMKDGNVITIKQK